MIREKFFSVLRARSSSLFGNSLTQRQQDGVGALLDAGHALPMHHMANVLAQVYHETGRGMYPIKETVFPWHKDKHPTDADVIRRLDRAFAAGKLPWVKSPYWRGGAFGRGQIQITYAGNYAKFGITNFDDALKLDVSARIAVEGMACGMFTGKKLADYDFPIDLCNPPRSHPRRIVNGADGSDGNVRTYHLAFAAALEVAGWQPSALEVAPSAAPTSGLWVRILGLLASLIKGDRP